MSAGTEAALRQMIAALAVERQALAALDIDALLACSVDKASAADRVGDPGPLDDTCRALATEAKRLNESNLATVRLLSANISSRLSALTGQVPLYAPMPNNAALLHA